jgi:hypothetical protein
MSGNGPVPEEDPPWAAVRPVASTRSLGRMPERPAAPAQPSAGAAGEGRDTGAPGPSTAAADQSTATSPAAPSTTPADQSTATSAAPSTATTTAGLGTSRRAAEPSTATADQGTAEQSTTSTAGAVAAGSAEQQRATAVDVASLAARTPGLSTPAVPQVRISPRPPSLPPATDPPPLPVARRRLWSTSRSGLDRLQIGGHTCTRATLEHWGAAEIVRELRLGSDRDGAAVTFRPFRAGAASMVLVGGRWAAHFLIWRALQAGARVLVITDDPVPWQEFVTRTLEDPTLVRVLTPAGHRDAVAGLSGPALIVDDAGALPDSPTGVQQTVLTLLPSLTPDRAGTLAGASLVLLQRLTAEEAAIAASALRLSDRSTALLQRLEPDMLGSIGGGGNRYIWLSLDQIEQGLLGPAVR